MKNIVYVSAAVAACLMGGAVQSAEAPNNCKSQATPLSLGSTSVTTVRAWNEYSFISVYDKASGTFVTQRGAWLDLGTDGAKASDQIGCYWFYVNLTRGKDYVVEVELPAGFNVFENNQVPAKNKLSSVAVGGKQYFYIRADDWDSFGDQWTYYFQISASSAGSVGRSIPVKFQEMSIDEILKDERPGSLKSPISLDVTTSGSAVVAEPADTLYNKKITAYTVTLKPGVTYVFSGDATVQGVDMSIDTTEEVGDEVLAGTFPGTFVSRWNASDTAAIELTVAVSVEYTMTLVVSPDDFHSTMSMAGRTLSWTVGGEAEPTSAGTYLGRLESTQPKGVTVGFAVVVKLMDNGTTNLSASVTLDGGSYAFLDTGHGDEVLNSREIGGISYDSSFGVKLMSDGQASVDGSIYNERGEEIFFQGLVQGSQVAWEQSFLRFEPGATAEKMGITCDAFKSSEAPTLGNLQNWGALYNVSVQRVNDEASFSAHGDPLNALSEAFLLNCGVSAASIAEAGKAFAITAFDAKEKVVTVAGNKHDGDDYVYGRIEIRTSEDVAGPYVKPTGSGTAPARLFYKAYLVK